MTFEYFDVHSHIYFPDFDKDREEEIEKIKKEKIGTITIGTDFESSQKAIEIAEKHKNFFACIGQHPGDLKEDSVFDERLIDLADNKKVVAIGECGLDYFRMPARAGGDPNDTELKTIQKSIFEYHIDLAISKQKPLMLHIRSSKGTMDAYSDALDILEHHAKTSGDALKGNAHFFAGDLDVLKRFLEIGFTASFTGVITFTSDYDELIKYIPIDRILSETDAPFVAPVPHRGKRNSPLYVKEVVKRMAEIKGVDEEVLKKALIDNTLRVFPGVQSKSNG
ncbi:MAG TPA: TatD family hydrolase [Candidatus Paceibacterota bacterium]